MTERKKICRDCYKELTERGSRLGVCRNCAGKEVKKLRKRLIVSFLVGAALVGSVLAFRNHICSVYYFQKPGGDVVVPLFFGNVLVNDQFFFDMFYPSRTGGILFLAICFFAPFSSFIRIDYPNIPPSGRAGYAENGAIYCEIRGLLQSPAAGRCGDLPRVLYPFGRFRPVPFRIQDIQAGPPVGSAEAWGLVNKFLGADDAIYRGRKRW